MIIFNIKLIHLTLLSISAARAQSGASIASQAPLEFDSPEAWYAGMDTIERRFAELSAKGPSQTLAEVLADQEARDLADASWC